MHSHINQTKATPSILLPILKQFSRNIHLIIHQLLLVTTTIIKREEIAETYRLESTNATNDRNDPSSTTMTSQEPFLRKWGCSVSVQNSHDTGLAGIETALFLTILVVCTTLTLTTLLRVSVAKTQLGQIAYSAARYESITMSTQLPSNLQSAKVLGRHVSVSTLTTPSPCSVVVVRAQTYVPLIPMPIFPTSMGLVVSSIQQAPTDAYLNPQTLGMNCGIQ